MMLTKTGGECVQWGWEEEEEEEEEKEEFEERRREEEGGAGGQGEGGGEDIEKVLFDSVTTRTRGSVMEGVNEEKSEEPRRGVPRQASSPDLTPPPSSAPSPLPPTLLNLFLCLCICIYL